MPRCACTYDAYTNGHDNADCPIHSDVAMEAAGYQPGDEYRDPDSPHYAYEERP